MDRSFLLHPNVCIVRGGLFCCILCPVLVAFEFSVQNKAKACLGSFICSQCIFLHYDAHGNKVSDHPDSCSLQEGRFSLEYSCECHLILPVLVGNVTFLIDAEIV